MWKLIPAGSGTDVTVGVLESSPSGAGVDSSIDGEGWRPTESSDL